MTVKHTIEKLKFEAYALYLAYGDPKVPLHARVFAACVVGYALSPIDLIPDPIPVPGYLDDLILVSLGIVLAARMIPREVLDKCREKARAEVAHGRPVVSKVAAVVCVWLLLAAAVAVVAFRVSRG